MMVACDVSTNAHCSPGMSSSPSAVWIQGAFRPCSHDSVAHHTYRLLNQC